MRRLLILFLAAFLFCGCQSKPEVKFDPDRKEHEAHPQKAPESVPEAGVEALKDIKKIQKREDAKVKENQKVLEQADSQ